MQYKDIILARNSTAYELLKASDSKNLAKHMKLLEANRKALENQEPYIIPPTTYDKK